MTTTKQSDGFWITDTPEGVVPMGPYQLLSDAQDDLAGIERFLANENRRSFFTVDREKTEAVAVAVSQATLF